MNFAISPAATSTYEYYHPLQKLPPSTAEIVRASVFVSLNKYRSPPTNITPLEKKLSELSREEKIWYADKGQSTVVLTVSEYEQKAHDILQGNHYTILQRDPTLLY